MASLSQQERFVSQYGPLANNIAQQTGDSPAEILGQWALETGWGSETIMGSNNPGNIQMGGQNVNFSTPGSFASEYTRILKRLGAVNDANNVGAFPNFSSLGSGGNGGSATPGVCILDMGGYGTCGGSSKNPGNAKIADGAGASQGGNGKGCVFDLMDPIPWIECEAFNVLFILLGLAIILAIIYQQIGDGKSFPMPIVPA